MNAPPIDVLVVDASRELRAQLVALIETEPGLRVTGALGDGAAALAFVERNPPQVVLMDTQMRDMDGFEATRRIMQSRPVPIVLCSAAHAPEQVATAFRAIEAGAVAVVEKPDGSAHPQQTRLRAELVATVKLMSEVKVVRRWARKGDVAAAAPARIGVVGIGASTGGPPALQAVLGGLPRDVAVPILIVQHITVGFLPGLAQWLGQTTGFEVCIAEAGMEPLAGHAYLAPDHHHMAIGADGRIHLDREAPENGLRPAIDHLFRSLAHHCGAGALGVLLTGMGRDGAAQLKAMRDRGAVTIVQDRDSAVVHGMPGAAIELGAAGQVLALDAIADAICGHLRRRNQGRATT